MAVRVVCFVKPLGNVARVSPRLRVIALVVVAAVAAAGATVGITELTKTETGPTAAVVKPRRGAPPLALDLGVRTDSEARALRRAAVLYEKGKRREAGRIFSRYSSLQAQLGGAFASWPDSLDAVQALARDHPRSAVAQLDLGLVLFWTGRNAEAVAAWQTAVRVDPDSDAAVRADDLLHPNFAQGLPVFVPSFGPPAALARLSPPTQLAYLARRAAAGGVRARLLYGVALQRLGRQLSAELQYASAAATAPNDAEAQVAAAVGLFDKVHPERAFSRLGPLVKTFPHAPTVRFHLGLLLLWTGRLDQAKRELIQAEKEGPKTPLGREAGLFLLRLASLRTM